MNRYRTPSSMGRYFNERRTLFHPPPRTRATSSQAQPFSSESRRQNEIRLASYHQEKAQIASGMQAASCSIEQSREQRHQVKTLNATIASLSSAIENQNSVSTRLTRACEILQDTSIASNRNNEDLERSCKRIEMALDQQMYQIRELCDKLMTFCLRLSDPAETASCAGDSDSIYLANVHQDIKDLRHGVERCAVKHNCTLSGDTFIERLFVAAKNSDGSTTMQRIGVADQL